MMTHRDKMSCQKIKSDLWKVLTPIFLALSLLVGAELFVTFCAFSSMCPVVEEIADLSVTTVP
jgi:hypothetical protein